MGVVKSILATLALACSCSVAIADEWIAERLRGDVLQYERGNWVTLERGDVVPDGGKVRTTGTGRVDLVRGQESIALGPNTQIAVRDAAGQKMTSVIQSSGVVTVTAEKRNVQHFSVQTPILAAIVKGTQFTVTYSNGLARVDVTSGIVQVQDSIHDVVVDVTRGQSAAASQARPLELEGPGADKAVFLIGGVAVPAGAREAFVSGVGVETAAAATSGIPVTAGAGNTGVTAGVGATAGTGATATVGAGTSPGTGVTATAGASAGGGNLNVTAGAGVGGTGVTAGAAAGTGGTSAGASVGNGGAGGATVNVDLGPAELSVGVGGGGGGLGVKLGL